MTFRDRWLRRTDDARRTKGDPPPTYAQLMANIRQTQAALALAEQIATNLRHQCDGLIVENARLRVVAAEKTEYAEALALDLAKATQAVPLWLKDWSSAEDALYDDDPARFWCCPIDGHTEVMWRDNVAHCEGCGRSSADDPDPARPYIKSPEATT